MIAILDGARLGAFDTAGWAEGDLLLGVLCGTIEPTFS